MNGTEYSSSGIGATLGVTPRNITLVFMDFETSASCRINGIYLQLLYTYSQVYIDLRRTTLCGARVNYMGRCNFDYISE